MLSLSKLFFFAVVAGVASAAPDQGKCARTYTVKSGDTCNSIAAANNAPTAQIIAANPGVINSSCSNLFGGKNICLGITGKDCQKTYVVKAGDNCYNIAKANHIPQDVFYGNNPPCPNIFSGQVLCNAPNKIL